MPASHCYAARFPLEEIRLTETRQRQIEAMVAEIVRSRYPRTEFTDIQVFPEPFDDDGDVLRVEIFYAGDDAEIDPDIGIGSPLRRMIHDRLDAMNEEWFPVTYFRRAADVPA